MFIISIRVWRCVFVPNITLLWNDRLRAQAKHQYEEASKNLISSTEDIAAVKSEALLSSLANLAEHMALSHHNAVR